MNGLVDRWLKINLRVVVLTILLLVGFDLSLTRLILPYYLDADTGKAQVSAGSVERGPVIRRLPADDINTLTLWKQELAGNDGFKVVFLGDSIIHGGGVPDEDQTIPSYFAHHLKSLIPDQDINVYCFSLPGCTPTDTVNILQFMVEAEPDLVIYDVNIGWFGSGKVMEHPRLAELSQTVAKEAQPTAESARKIDLERWVSDFATDHWALYRHRILLNYLWFGEPLKERLALKAEPPAGQESENRLTSPEEIFKPWYEKDFSALKKARGTLGYCTLNDSNQHWVSYNQLVKILEKNQVKAAFFMIPRNKTLYDRYNLLDDKVLEDKQNRLASAARQHGVKVFDYTYSVNDRYFVDSVHLTDKGNQTVAKLLTWDLIKSRAIKVGEQ